MPVADPTDWQLSEDNAFYRARESADELRGGRERLAY